MKNNEGNTHIKSNQVINQYKYCGMDNPPNYNQNNIINPTTYYKKNNNLNNKDNNIDQKYQKMNKNENNLNLNPKKEFNSEANKNKKQIANNNKDKISKDFENYVTPNGEDTQDLRNYYKYIYNEKTDKKNNNNNNPSNQNEKEQKDISFSLSNYKKACLVAIDDVGNTSYMSAIIRILSNIKNLVKYYLTELNNINIYLQEIPLTYAFSRIIFHLYPFPQDSLKKSISIDNFYRISLLLNSSFKGTSTKNGIDYLNFLLDTLHNNDKFFRNKNNNGDNNNTIKNHDIKEYITYLDNYEKSIIFDNFAWINQKVRKCNSCGEENNSYLYYFTYDVNILNSLEKIVMDSNKDDINIFDCIKEQSKKKRLHNIYCFKCKNKTFFDEENIIYSSPNYFIFLIRINEEETKNKIKESNKKIIIDKELFLKNIIKGSQKNYLYELIGKVDYCFNSKEYVSSCRDLIDNNWYKYENRNSQYKISKIDFTDKYLNYDVLPVIVVYKIKKDQ